MRMVLVLAVYESDVRASFAKLPFTNANYKNGREVIGIMYSYCV